MAKDPKLLGQQLAETLLAGEELVIMDTDYSGILKMTPTSKSWRSIFGLIKKCEDFDVSEFSSSFAIVHGSYPLRPIELLIHDSARN